MSEQADAAAPGKPRRLRDAAAEGWGKRAQWLREHTAAVSEWLVDALELQPGHRVLELAAGPGETGFLAAELIAPGGTLICSDQSEAMLAVARARAEELGLRNVEFRVLDGEWIDLPLAGLDAVVCRWGCCRWPTPPRRCARPAACFAAMGACRWRCGQRRGQPWAAVPAGVLVERGPRSRCRVLLARSRLAIGSRCARCSRTPASRRSRPTRSRSEQRLSFREWWRHAWTPRRRRGALAGLDAPARARIEREIETRLSPTVWAAS